MSTEGETMYSRNRFTPLCLRSIAVKFSKPDLHTFLLEIVWRFHGYFCFIVEVQVCTFV